MDELPLQLHRLGVRHVLVVVSGGEIDDFAGVTQSNGGQELDFTCFEGKRNILGRAEYAAFTPGTGL